MKTKLLLFFLFAPLLRAAHTPAEIESHRLAMLQKEYREAALVVVADLSSDDRNVIVDTREVWKAAPGYTSGRILIPKEPGAERHPGTYGPPGVKKSLVCFYLKEYVTHWGGFTIENERVLVAPNYTLAELRKVLDESLNRPNQPSEPTPTSGTSAAEQPRVPAAVVAHL